MPATPLDYQHARRFLNALFSAKPVGALYCEVRCLQPPGQEGAPRQFWLNGQNGASFPWQQVAQLNARGFGIHFGVNLRRCQRGREEDVGEIRVLWCDLDVQSPAHPTGRHLSKRDAFNALATRLPADLFPSAIVDTGNGLQCFWFLQEPLPVTNGSTGPVKQTLVSLERTLDGDPTSDLCRVLRLPGTWNMKDPAHPKPVRLVHFAPRRRFNLTDFAPILCADAPPGEDADAEPITFTAYANLPKVNLGDLRVSKPIKTLIKQGWQRGGKYRTRSEADQAVITALRQGDHAPNEIKAVFARTAWGIGAKVREKREPEVDRYLRQCIQQADVFLAQDQVDPNGPHLLWTPSASPPDIRPVRETVNQCFPALWDLTTASLATVAGMLPDDVVNPPTLIVEGASSGGKTTVLDEVDGTPYVAYRSDKFTPKSFVTHATNIPGERIEDVDLLPRIRFRVMLTGELSPLFRGREQDLVENFAMLTAVLDGRGLMSDSGSRGRRGYEGDYLFAWLGATTPLPSRTWRIMQQLGARLLFFWLHTLIPGVDELVDSLNGAQSYREKLAACRHEVNTFLLALFRAHGRRDQERPFGVSWRRQDDPTDVLTRIGHLASVGAMARGVVSGWSDEAGEMNFQPPVVEQPYRFNTLLYNLARGHALLHGRTQLTTDDLPVVTRVALDSMPLERRKILRLLLAHAPGVQQPTTVVAWDLECSKPWARRLMRELALLQVAEVQDDARRKDGEQPGLLIALPEALAWLATPDVRRALDLPADDAGAEFVHEDLAGTAATYNGEEA